MHKELERQLSVYGIRTSVDKVLTIAKTIPSVKIKMPDGRMVSKTMTFTDEQNMLLPLLNT